MKYEANSVQENITFDYLWNIYQWVEFAVKMKYEVNIVQENIKIWLFVEHGTSTNELRLTFK